MGGLQSVLVTGGAGYIGSYACKVLARVGYRPVVFDNLSRGHREAVRWGPFVQGDLADREALATALRSYQVSAVMHFAAYAYVGESVDDPATYYRNNLGGSLALLDAMREVGVNKIVFSSTCATYGTPNDVPIRETAPQLPVNPYGETKLAIERALHWYGEAYGLRSVSLRYFDAAFERGLVDRGRYERWVRDHFFQFREPATWLNHMRRYCFSYGTRLHGNMAAIIAGARAVWVVHDMRLKEVCEYFRLPWVELKDVRAGMNVEALYDRADFYPCFQVYPDRYRILFDYIDGAGLPHSLPTPVGTSNALRDSVPAEHRVAASVDSSSMPHQ